LLYGGHFVKREAKLLLERAVDALVLGIEIFNRPSNRGRTEAVLIHLDHSFEMLLKAAILDRGGRIREQGDPHTIGFDHCLRASTSRTMEISCFICSTMSSGTLATLRRLS
jgi:hypothetical protein